MTLYLTEDEQTVLLGILEDLSQEEDIYDFCCEKSRKAIKEIIVKLGGTYFGKL